MSLTLKQFTPLLAVVLGMGIIAEPGQAQSITSAADGTETIVTPDGNRFDIHGGSLSEDGANLFHSFEKFGLSKEQIANFLSNPEIQNILGRVIGGNASFVDGLIQVTGGNSNLFLMNPSGFIFGHNAQLNVPASFTATTANGIQFGDRWFNASGMNDHAALVGNPSGFAFTMAEPGAIINAGDLAVNAEQSLSLLGGTVASTGKLSAPGGEIIVTAVPGTSLVRLNMPGNVLGIEIDPTALGGSQPIEWNLPISALPDLLTVGAIEQNSGLAVNPQGQAIFAESSIPIASGDVTVKDLAARSAVLSANLNLTLVESQLSTTGHFQLLAKDTVRIRDSETKPFLVQAGEDLYIQGNQNIDILALNHPETPFQSGGDLTLVSDGDISGDAHFASGGDFSMLDLKGEPGNFVSYYDPIITALGDVEFGDYTGVALKVEAIGSIQGGDITITGPDENLSGSDPDIPTLTSSPALILRAGVSLFDLENRPNDPESSEETNFEASRDFSTSGAINVGSIDTSSGTGRGGTVILNAVGDDGSITVNGDVNASSTAGDGGTVRLSALGSVGTIKSDEINTSSTAGDDAVTGNGGDVTLEAIGNVEVGVINTQGSNNLGDIDQRNIADGGDVTVDTRGNFRINSQFFDENDEEEPTDSDQDILNIFDTNIENLLTNDSRTGVSITAQGANDGSARGGEVTIKIGSEETFPVANGATITDGSGIIGTITNSPRNDVNQGGNGPDSDAERGFQTLTEGGGLPSPGNSENIDGDSNQSGVVSNSVSPQEDIANNNAQDTISRQEAAIAPGNAILITDAPPQQEDIANLENQCEDEEKWNQFIDEIEDEELREELEREREKICETEDP